MYMVYTITFKIYENLLGFGIYESKQTTFNLSYDAIPLSLVYVCDW